jgi:hypothetical protein
MKKSILFSLVMSTIMFVTCTPQLFYNITNNNSSVYEYQINTRLKSINISVFANYSWVGKNAIETALNFYVENDSKYEILVDTKNMLISSKFFDYKIKPKNVTIEPQSNHIFWLEYKAVFDPHIYLKSGEMPKDEELILMVKGFSIKGRTLPIDDISFVPKEREF